MSIEEMKILTWDKQRKCMWVEKRRRVKHLNYEQKMDKYERTEAKKCVEDQKKTMEEMKMLIRDKQGDGRNRRTRIIF